MRNIAAHRDNSDIFLLSKGTGQQRIAAAVFNKYGFTGLHRGGSKFRQLALQGKIIEHAGFNIVAFQRYRIAMGAAQIALLFQRIQILADSHFRYAGCFSQIGHANPAFINHHLQNSLLSGIHRD